MGNLQSSIPEDSSIDDHHHGIIDRTIKNARASGAPFIITQPVEGLKKFELVNGKWIPCTTPHQRSSEATTTTTSSSSSSATSTTNTKLTPAVGRLSNAAEDALLNTARPGQESEGSNISDYHDATSCGNGGATADAVDKSTEQPFVDPVGSDDPHHSGHHRANKTTIFLNPSTTEGINTNSSNSSNSNAAENPLPSKTYSSFEQQQQRASSSPPLCPLRVPFPPFPISTPLHAPFFQPLSSKKNENKIIPNTHNGTTTASSVSTSPNSNIENNITAAAAMVSTTTAGNTYRSNTNDDDKNESKGIIASSARSERMNTTSDEEVSISTPSSISNTTTGTATAIANNTTARNAINPMAKMRYNGNTPEWTKNPNRDPSMKRSRPNGTTPLKWGNDAAEKKKLDWDPSIGLGAVSTTTTIRMDGPTTTTINLRGDDGASPCLMKKEQSHSSTSGAAASDASSMIVDSAQFLPKKPTAPIEQPRRLLVPFARKKMAGLSSNACTTKAAGATNDDDEKQAPRLDIQCNTNRNGQKANDEENNVTKPTAKKMRKTMNDKSARVGLHDTTNTSAITSLSSRSKHDASSTTPKNDEVSNINNNSPSNSNITERGTRNGVLGNTIIGREQGELYSQYKTDDTKEQHEEEIVTTPVNAAGTDAGTTSSGDNDLLGSSSVPSSLLKHIDDAIKSEVAKHSLAEKEHHMEEKQELKQQISNLSANNNRLNELHAESQQTITGLRQQNQQKDAFIAFMTEALSDHNKKQIEQNKW